MKFFHLSNGKGIYCPYSKKLAVACAVFGLLAIGSVPSQAADHHPFYNRHLEQIQLKGKVVSDDGTPLAGASVKIKGSTAGTATDANGNFTLNVSENDVLIVSYLGYQTSEIPVDGKTSLSVTLKSQSNSLGDVVVVAYGKQKKVNLTGSVSSINADKEINWKPVGQVSEALQGVAPGVTVTQSTGQPGVDQGTIRIRGVGTLNNNNPLVLVDGVQYNINDVDPNDIQSISVLKDAAAASIYGVQAANGVILITTKRGAAGKTKVNYSNYFGWQKPARLPEFVGAQEFMKLANQMYENSGGGAVFSDSAIAQYNNPNRNKDLYPDNNWMKDVLTGSGFQQEHTIALSGGSDKVKYRFSGNYFDQKGLIQNMDFNRFTVRLNTDIKLTDKLSMTADMSARLSDRTEPQDNGAGSAWFQFGQAAVTNPTIISQYSDGTWGIGRGDGNVIRIQNEGGIFDFNDNLITGNFRANYEVIKGLTLSGIASANYDVQYNSLHTKALNYYNFFSNPQTLIATKGQNAITQQYNGTWFKNFQGLADYKFDINYDHRFHILAGASSLSQSTNYLNGYRNGIPNGVLNQINAGAANGQTTSGDASEYSLISYFGRFNYSFRDKYLFEANLRHDGSSRFAKGHNWGTFPSFSAGWRISQEDFMKSVSSIQDLKLRASWGKLGNDAIGNYPYQATIGFGNSYAFGNVLNTTAHLSSLPNYLLTWENTTMSDVGLDMTLMKHLDLTFDYYKKNTNNILMRLPIPETVGLNPPYQNAGAVQNKGWEVSATYHNKAGKDFSYSIGANLSDVRNKITDLKGADYSSTDNNSMTTAYMVGLPIGSYYGYVAQGFFQSQDQINNHAVQPGNIAPGDLIYQDQNKDNVINSKDRVYLGSNIPRYTYGVTLNATYKNFDFVTLFQGVGKVDIFTAVMKRAPISTDGNFKVIQEDAWTPDNTDANYPRLVRSNQNYVTSSYWVENGAYLRLKSLQLGYTLPASLTSKAKIDRLRIYVSGQNLLTFSKLESDIDPESPNDNRYYPQVKVYTIGLNLGF